MGYVSGKNNSSLNTPPAAQPRVSKHFTGQAATASLTFERRFFWPIDGNIEVT